ncbi:spindle and kinetochore-associated protein 3 isoform X2 [Pogoniulus pusillus]|uniref:spindle and kinetochore-associated protein 3 isoform X2 n=1 Tax=Pogoniulus pusillus TaxID=488313 RepID=UPI0030B943B5
MDVSRVFFSNLRDLCLTLEKEARQLDQALPKEDTDYEDESPLRVLHDVHCEIKTLKEDVNASLGKSCSSKQEIHHFMKESETMMQINASNLGKIRELFQKYGYKPHVKNSTAEEKEEVSSYSTESVQSKSDEEEADDVLHLPPSTEKPPVPEDPLRNPQLSDFGLSQYAFSKPWSDMKEQPPTKAYQAHSNNRTPLKMPAPGILPKTPKCRLKMEDYECATPKLEHFGISEHTMCMNEDYTMSLIHKTAQAVTKLVKNVDHEMKVSEMTSRGIMVTPRPRQKMTNENAADWMTSPMVFVFCTPDVKISPRTNSTVSSRSPGTNELPPPSRTETPRCPDFETRWLVKEAQQVMQREKIQSVTKNDATTKKPTEDRIPFAVSSDNYLKRFEDPSPPKIKSYDELLDTPPPPEITRIPDDVLQILSKYNYKSDSSTDKENGDQGRKYYKIGK